MAAENTHLEQDRIERDVNSRSVSPVSSLGPSDNTPPKAPENAPPKIIYDFTEEEKDEHDHGIDWRPGWKEQFPWTGFTGFLTMLVATVMAVTILCVSNHKRVADWPFRRFTTQPNVLLNIANQVQNLGLLTMIAQGLAIAWWRKALRGSSLNTLHRNHAYSYSFYAILTAGRNFNIVALAALMTKFAVVDSTLYQKATKTAITQQTSYMNSSVTAWIATEWPENSGGIPGKDNNIKTVDVNWAKVIDAYTGKIANGKMHDSLDGLASFFGCPFRQECRGAIEALGFAYNCTTEREDIDYGLQHQRQPNNSSPFPLWNATFHPNWATAEKPYASVQFDMLYADTHRGEQPGSCPGFVTRRSCEIRPAVVEYPLTVMIPSEEELKGRNIVTHVKFFNETKMEFGADLSDQQVDKVKFVRHHDLNETAGQISTVGALSYVLSNLYTSSAELVFDGEWDIKVQGSQAQSVFYTDTDDTSADEDAGGRCYYDIDAKDREGKRRDDPAVAILRKMNTLAFTAALYLNGAAATDVKDRAAANMPSQNITTSVTGIVEEYTTDFAYMAGAIVATLVTLLAVLPVYWGYWQLGRKVTLGALEITQAFGAPIVAPARYKNTHGDFDHILSDVGDRRVQYGQLVGAPRGQMGIAEPKDVQYPDTVVRAGSRSTGRVAGFGIGAVLGGTLAGILGANAKD